MNSTDLVFVVRPTTQSNETIIRGENLAELENKVSYYFDEIQTILAETYNQTGIGDVLLNEARNCFKQNFIRVGQFKEGATVGTKVQEVGLRCPVAFDSWKCWSSTLADTVSVQNCPDFPHLGFSSHRSSSKFCTPEGVWWRHPLTNTTWSNYTQCVDVQVFNFHKTVTILSLTGLTTSLVALIISLIIFYMFKNLKCGRITMHKNLFLALSVNNIMWLTWYLMLMRNPTIWFEHPIFCRILHVVKNYFLLSTYTWMLGEGLYLQLLLTNTWRVKDKQIMGIKILSWSTPLLSIVPYTISRVYDDTLANQRFMEGGGVESDQMTGEDRTEGDSESVSTDSSTANLFTDVTCWTNTGDKGWYLSLLVIVVLIANTMFMINVIRIVRRKRVLKLKSTSHQGIIDGQCSSTCRLGTTVLETEVTLSVGGHDDGGGGGNCGRFAAAVEKSVNIPSMQLEEDVQNGDKGEFSDNFSNECLEKSNEAKVHQSGCEDQKKSGGRGRKNWFPSLKRATFRDSGQHSVTKHLRSASNRNKSSKGVDTTSSSTTIQTNAKCSSTLKAAKAALILIPVLGLQFIILPMRPPDGSWLTPIYEIVSAIVSSFQGLMVAIIFCFMNQDVIDILRSKFRRYKRNKRHESSRILQNNKLRKETTNEVISMSTAPNVDAP